MANKFALKLIFWGFLLGTVFCLGLFFNRLMPAEQPAAPAVQQPSVQTPEGSGDRFDQEDDRTPAVPTPLPANQPINQPSPAQARCIITILGKQYDVTPLRNTHTGGDVFVCGTDMTSVFQGRHGNNLNLIAPYLVQ